MATTTQLTRVIALAVQDATAQHPNDVERRATTFTQMLCGALHGLDYPEAAAAIRTMLGVRTTADSKAAEVC